MAENATENVDSKDPIIWWKNGDDDSSTSFQNACLLAANTRRPLHIAEPTNITLKETIILRKRQCLHIQSSSSTRSSISGDLHSLFLLNNHSQLILENVDLNHTLQLEKDEDHRKVGAAVNLRYKSSLIMTNGSISSHCGFCCWAVQKTSVQLIHCRLEATIRSPVVCFGQPNVLLRNCTIENAGVHAVCGRGACHITLQQCHISKSASRAIYAYAEACLVLQDTIVSETIRPDKAAIEVSAKGVSSNNNNHASSSITMQNCQIVDNAGIGLLLRGSVICNLQDTMLERNAGGNKVQTESLQEEETGQSVLLLRDPSGSSFRQGDWWCPVCKPQRVVVGAECQHCQSLHQPEYNLTLSEIQKLNQGSSILDSSTTSKKKSYHWYYDTDEQGMVRYDKQSNQCLEDAYQQYVKGGGKEVLVQIMEGTYQVNLERMEQVNLQSHFIRLVKRKMELMN
eukprot:scaffold11979_cov130-Cylindrotheca_fusiformis.AAC.5